jgi:hypothetical protein
MALADWRLVFRLLAAPLHIPDGGLEHNAKGPSQGCNLPNLSSPPSSLAKVHELKAEGMGPTEIAKALKIGPGVRLLCTGGDLVRNCSIAMHPKVASPA